MARTPGKPTPVLVSATGKPQRTDTSVHSALVVRSSASKNIRGPVSVVTNRGNPSSLAKPPAIVKVTPHFDTDHLSEVSSVHSFSVGLDKMKGPFLFNGPQLNPLTEDSDENPISKLPLISLVGDSILGVTQMSASRQGYAALVVNGSGASAGIITDTDITRRVVAKHVDTASTSISTVMTLNPTCVAMTDSAMRNGRYVDDGRESLPTPSGG